MVSCPGRRLKRQEVVFEWGVKSFGLDQMTSQKQRGLRMLEEAIELYQACCGDKGQAHKLVDYIFARPVGTPAQEIGGVSVTMLALAECIGEDADQCERTEIERVLSKSHEHFAKRNAAKNAAGFVAK